jgi:hypothetical protein
MNRVITYAIVVVYILLLAGVWLTAAAPMWISEEHLAYIATSLWTKGFSITQILRGFWFFGFISGLLVSPIAFALANLIHRRVRSRRVQS